jgi:pimeloyl-ACP methyl ester carboxylesterase
MVQEATIEVNGIELFYRQAGEGTPLLLLHGFFNSSHQWIPYLADLSADFLVVVPDMRGHGRSTNPSGKFTHRQYAQDVYALLDALEITTFHAVGYASGGMTLLHMATQQPHRIEAMSIWGATPYLTEQCRENQRSVSFEEVQRDSPEWLDIIRQQHLGGDDQIRGLVQNYRTMGETYDDMNFTPDHLSTITAQTQILHGDRDARFPIDIPITLYQAIPNASLMILPNTPYSLFENLLRFWGFEESYPPTSQTSFPSIVRQFLSDTSGATIEGRSSRLSGVTACR